LTVVILAFVAVAVGYLVVKEVRRAKAPEVAREGVSEPAPVATAEQELETGGTVDDYQLYAKSVIVADVRGGDEVRWKNLTRVWQLTRDKERFIKYIQDEVRDYLEAA